ncbi:MAG TPA: hypothetical protein VF365_01470 [Candidatus Limnocylindria bacterium]
MADPLTGRSSSAVLGTAGFFALVSLGAVLLLGQWLIAKLTQPGARIDIAEWPFVIVGAAIALLPLIAGIGLVREHSFGIRLGRIAAYLIGVVGALALLVALAQLSMGVAWTLLIGGGVLLVGAVFALRTLSGKAPGSHAEA